MGNGDERLMLPDLQDELRAFKVPNQPQYALVTSLDGILLLRRDVKSLLAPGDLKASVMSEKGQVAAGSLVDLPSLAILDRGRLVGLWEYDPETESIAWRSFIRPDAELKAAVRRTEEFVRADLGDVRSFSLDSPKSRAPRIRALREVTQASSP